MTMTWMDHILVLAFAVAWPAWIFAQYEAHKAQVRAGVAGARLAAYAEGMIFQWLFVAAAGALWIHQSRGWDAIGLTGLSGQGAWLALGAAALLGILYFAQSARVTRLAEAHAQVRKALAPCMEILPVQRTDLTGFIALSLTAGICEEILFRGVLGWYFTPWLGEWGAQGIALLAFSLAHSYLGVSGVARALAAGAVMAGLYLWSGSLLPSMLLHAGVDMVSGWMAYEVFRERPAQPAAAGA